MKSLFIAAAGIVVAAAPAQAAGPSSPPVPKGNPGLWVQTSDYPPSALREEGQGLVRFTLDVDATGVPVKCVVTQSSGRGDLDDAACQLITERARFEPAKDSRGRPVAGTYSNAVRWQIPQSRMLPKAGSMVISAVIEKDGTVSSCSVDTAEGSFESARSRACENPPTYDPILDADGKPVRKRIRTTMKVEIQDLP